MLLSTGFSADHLFRSDKETARIRLPDPRTIARREAERVKADRKVCLEAPIERVLADAPFVDRERLLSGLMAFRKERLERVPSATRYPESPPWVKHVLSVERLLQEMAGLTDLEMGILRHLTSYLAFRGYGTAATTASERCRVAFCQTPIAGSCTSRTWTIQPHTGAVHRQ